MSLHNCTKLGSNTQPCILYYKYMILFIFQVRLHNAKKAFLEYVLIYISVTGNNGLLTFAKKYYK